MELLLSALDILLRLDVLLARLIGVGPAIAIAILLPATFSLEPVVGLTLLLGIYGSAMYGGAIPVILINTPGCSASEIMVNPRHFGDKWSRKRPGFFQGFGSSGCQNIPTSIRRSPGDRS